MIAIDCLFLMVCLDNLFSFSFHFFHPVLNPSQDLQAVVGLNQELSSRFFVILLYVLLTYSYTLYINISTYLLENICRQEFEVTFLPCSH